MKVSIIIPTYNEEQHIVDCLNSIKNQTYKDLELIVVDDGSADNTLNFVSNLNFNNLIILKQKHMGPAAARNYGAQKSKGDILIFVDSDMVFDKKFVEKLIKPIIKNESKGTFSKDEYVLNWNNVWSKCWNINSNLPIKRRISVDYPDTQKVFRAILKREFEKVNGFSKGGYTDDWSLSEKLDYEATLAQDAVYYHKNPEKLSEIYKQSKWIAKRDYKFGFIGQLYTLFVSSFVISLIIGIYKSIKHSNFYFLIFKIIYDFGIFMGITEMTLFGKSGK